MKGDLKWIAGSIVLFTFVVAPIEVALAVLLISEGKPILTGLWLAAAIFGLYRKENFGK